MALKGLVPELYCSDFERTFDFYTAKLGFTALYQRPEERFAYLEREGSQIMIEELGAAREWISGELAYPFGRGINFQIAASDAQTLHDSLQRAGYEFFLPLEDKWYRKDTAYVGNRQFIVQDPDGYLLRFAQDLGAKTAQEIEAMENTQ
ncbi:MAG: VOC family protein [Alphaproteobacteria bacterium]|nr:VOC family protein [Alphaproteobacteria bacterium]